MANLHHFIATYGYWAVFLGTLAEGEAILLIAGFAAHRGYLDLPGVWAAAFLGSFLSDQVIFHLGRRLGRPFLAKRPRLQRRTERAFRLLERFRDAFILSFRFLYGLRIASPFAIGISSVSSARFFVLNAVAAMIWAVAIGAAGFAFGQAAELVFGDVARYEHYLFAAMLTGGALVWIVARIRRNSRGPS